MSHHSRWCWGLLVLLIPTTLCAADPDAASLAKVVDESVAAYARAMSGSDAKSVGALFTAEGEYIDSDGVVFHGRAAIEGEFAAVLQVRPKGKIAVEVVSIRPIGAGLLVEDGVSTFTPEGEGAANRTRYSAVHARQPDGKWLIASVRELEFDAVTPHEHLKSLAFLLGNWRQESDGAVVDTEWTWSDDGNFLTSRFTSKQHTGEVIKGTHRVGWDGERKQFRSWVFGSDGSFGEGIWTESGRNWSVQLNGVTGTGGRLSSVVSYEADGKDALVISQSQRSAGGIALPSFSNRVVRQPPAPTKGVTTR